VKAPLRVVRSLETYTVRRQLNRTVTQETSDWVWVTTLPLQQAPTARIVAWGHQRWDIENFGFNEMVNGWEADHIYKHDGKAIEAFLLMVVPGLQHFSCLHWPQPQAPTAQQQTGEVLGLSDRRPALRGRRNHAQTCSLIGIRIGFDHPSPSLLSHHFFPTPHRPPQLSVPPARPPARLPSPLNAHPNLL
jgi:hypothetical protein